MFGLQDVPYQLLRDSRQMEIFNGINNVFSKSRTFQIFGHIDVEARVGVPKSTIAVTGIGVTSRP